MGQYQRFTLNAHRTRTTFDPEAIQARQRYSRRVSKLLSNAAQWRRYAKERDGLGRLITELVELVYDISLPAWDIGGDELLKQVSDSRYLYTGLTHRPGRTIDTARADTGCCKDQNLLSIMDTVLYHSGPRKSQPNHWCWLTSRQREADATHLSVTFTVCRSSFVFED